ncbi:AAA family ATPase [Roseateles sp. L2-2]|uniref:AAA family ATPase n=1 Tax=Roseateles TaxID=93681 RepID=UPI003D3670B0
MLQVENVPNRTSSIASNEDLSAPSRLFHRSVLASTVAGELMSESFKSGLFLTGPRRTGKTTFVRGDLVAALEREHEALVIYVDLWDDQKMDPGLAIYRALALALDAFDGLLVRMARRIGLKGVRLCGVEISLEQINAGRVESLTTSLRRLTQLSGRRVVLVVDEAHRLQTTELGRVALHGLKAARDALLLTPGPGFRFLATGSHAHKLEHMVREKQEPFLCARTRALPVMGEDFLQWQRALWPENARPGLPVMAQAFERLFHRVEDFIDVCDASRGAHLPDAEEADRSLFEKVDASLARDKRIFAERLISAGPLSTAFLVLKAEMGHQFAPHFSRSHERVMQLLALMGETAIRPDFSMQGVDATLARLAELELLWHRRIYVIEDARHVGWLREMDLSRLFGHEQRAVEAA